MTSSLKSYFYFLRMIQSTQYIQQCIESISIIPKGKGMVDDYTIMILDEAVVFKLGNIYANKICHKDDLLKIV